jgi:parallel beta-helix repeat protein
MPYNADYSSTMPSGAIRISVGSNIQSIVNSAPEGATFWLEAGVHRMQSIQPKNGQTFIGAKGAVLSGAEQITSFTQQNGLWVASGQTQEGQRNGTDAGISGFQRAGYPETFFIDDKPLKPVDSISKVVSGTFYFDYGADKIYFADNPAGHKVEAGKVASAFKSSASNVTIKNVVVEKYNSPVQYGAIHADGQNWTVSNVEARLNYGVGIYTRGTSKVLDSYVHDNGQMGLGGTGKGTMLIEGNEIANNGHWSGIDQGWEAGGSKWSETDALTVRNNYTHDNYGYGFWTDINNINTLYEGNLVSDNSHGGIVHEISYKATIRGNTLEGNGQADNLPWLWGAAILIQNSKDADIYGNVVDMSGGGNGIGLIQQNRGSGTYGAWVTTGNKVHDNVVIERSGDGKSGLVADWNASEALNGGNVFSNNKYYMDANSGNWAWGSDMNWSQFSAHDQGGSVSTATNAPVGAPQGKRDTW